MGFHRHNSDIEARAGQPFKSWFDLKTTTVWQTACTGSRASWNYPPVSCRGLGLPRRVGTASKRAGGAARVAQATPPPGRAPRPAPGSDAAETRQKRPLPGAPQTKSAAAAGLGGRTRPRAHSPCWRPALGGEESACLLLATPAPRRGQRRSGRAAEHSAEALARGA